VGDLGDNSLAVFHNKAIYFVVVGQSSLKKGICLRPQFDRLLVEDCKH
jgi:hypothetical protein